MNYFARAFSDNGEPSSSRIMSAIIGASGVFCLVFLTIKNHAIPDLGSLTLFVSTGVGVFYGLNQAKNASVSILGQKEQPKP